MVTLAPRSGCPNSEPPAAEITDVLWASAAPEDQLEHVSIRSCSGLVHLGFYSRLGMTTAAAATTAICRRALTSPALRGWEVATLRPAPENPPPGPDL